MTPTACPAQSCDDGMCVPEAPTNPGVDSDGEITGCNCRAAATGGDAAGGCLLLLGVAIALRRMRRR